MRIKQQLNKDWKKSFFGRTSYSITYTYMYHTFVWRLKIICWYLKAVSKKKILKHVFSIIFVIIKVHHSYRRNDMSGITHSTSLVVINNMAVGSLYSTCVSSLVWIDIIIYHCFKFTLFVYSAFWNCYVVISIYFRSCVGMYLQLLSLIESVILFFTCFFLW